MSEICHTINSIGFIICCNFCFSFAVGDLRPIIPLVLEFFYTLGRLRSGFCPRLEVSSAIDSLEFIFPFNKKFANIVNSPEPGNYVVLLVYLSGKNNTFAIKFYILGLRSSTPATGFYISFPIISDLEFTNYISYWLCCFDYIKLKKC